MISITRAKKNESAMVVGDRLLFERNGFATARSLDAERQFIQNHAMIARRRTKLPQPRA
jgi:hypothetical protein